MKNLPKIHPEYGGVLTYIKDLEIGTKFFVKNGLWTGEIIAGPDRKLIKVIESNNTFKIPEDYYAWVEII